MGKVMVDTSAIYALIDRSDNNHIDAKKALSNLSKDNAEILITNFLVAECHSLLTARLGHELAREWLENMFWPVERVAEEDEKVAKEIIIIQNDKSFSFTDATTFAVMKRLGIKKYFGYDRHFRQFGFIKCD